MVRACELAYLTQAGAEIGVASTKAFTTQLAALLHLTMCLSRHHSSRNELESEIKAALDEMPDTVEAVLAHDAQIKALSYHLTNKDHALFLGRGIYHPIAMEGALKLKEISYIHAEAYPAGELKHGPLALVDENMPVVAVAPDDRLMEKLRSNLEEVRARVPARRIDRHDGGKMVVCAGCSEHRMNTRGCKYNEPGGLRPNTAECVSSRALLRSQE